MALVLGLYIFLVATVLGGIAAYGSLFSTCAIAIAVAMPSTFVATWVYLVIGLDRRGGIWEASRKEFADEAARQSTAEVGHI